MARGASCAVCLRHTPPEGRLLANDLSPPQPRRPRDRSLGDGACARPVTRGHKEEKANSHSHSFTRSFTDMLLCVGCVVCAWIDSSLAYHHPSNSKIRSHVLTHTYDPQGGFHLFFGKGAAGRSLPSFLFPFGTTGNGAERQRQQAGRQAVGRRPATCSRSCERGCWGVGRREARSGGR